MNNTTTTKTIVTVNNFKTTNNAIKSVKSLVATMEKNAFKVATLAAWSCGVELPNIPTNDKPVSKQSFADSIDKSRSTVSRWIGAVELTIKYGQFNAFNTSVFPFSFDKIFLIDKIKESGIDLDFTDGMGKTVVELEKMLKKDKTDDGDGEKAIIMYDGVMYEVSLAGLERLIENADIIESADIEK